MRILFLTSGRHVPSSRFRVQQFVPYLTRLGHHCTVAPSHPPKYQHYPLIGWRPSQRLRRLLRRLDWMRVYLGRFDVVVLERELFDDPSVEMEQQIRRICRSLVLDVDDAVFLRYPEKFEILASMSDVVIAGNEALRAKSSQWNDQVRLVPTCVDLQRFQGKRESQARNGPLVIGWTGTKATLENLKLLEGPLRRLAGQREYQLDIIAEQDASLSTLNLAGVRVRQRTWDPRREIEDLRQFDIGLMPLADNPWNHFKCGLKIIQYMALGIPAIASPVGVNSTIIQDGTNGLLASSDDSWLSALERLIDQPSLRQQIGQQGRRTVEESYSVEANLPLLVRALEEAAKRGTAANEALS